MALQTTAGDHDEEAHNHIAMARIAENCERYEDMKNEMVKLVALYSDSKCLDKECRNLLSVAFKNIVGSKRSSVRVLKSILSKEVPNTPKYTVLEQYLKLVLCELKACCEEVISLLDQYLLKSVGVSMEASSEENEELYELAVFFHKMRGDYFRYLAEVAEMDEDKNKDNVVEANAAYAKATELSNTASSKRQGRAILSPTNPIKLGLALNYSVFHYEIMDKSDVACGMAKTAFDSAIAELDTLPEEKYKDSTLIMQLLRDNLTLWQSEDSHDDREDGDAKE